MKLNRYSENKKIQRTKVTFANIPFLKKFCDTTRLTRQKFETYLIIFPKQSLYFYFFIYYFEINMSRSFISNFFERLYFFGVALHSLLF